ncbi:MAG TPA: gamma-glutamylcyclotransferase family protein [Cyclobacteriaceae bacterium]|nr:gamma-glutamylcyclotransferase family protein [Cyclobacteriaceae bacterium]
MNSASTYAFYGSLRRGMINYLEFETSLEFLYQEIIAGYRMYAMASFPYAVKTDNNSDLITVEVFRITNPDVERSIHQLEMNEGYYYDEVRIRDVDVGIYLFDQVGPDPLVKSGDWVNFFGVA